MTKLYQFDSGTGFYTGPRTAQIDPEETRLARESNRNKALGKKLKIDNGEVVEVDTDGAVKMQSVDVFDKRGKRFWMPEPVEPKEIDPKTLTLKMKMVPRTMEIPVVSNVVLPDQTDTVVYALPGRYETTKKPPEAPIGKVPKWTGEAWEVVSIPKLAPNASAIAEQPGETTSV